MPTPAAAPAALPTPAPIPVRRMASGSVQDHYLEPRELRALRSVVRGKVLVEGDFGYDAARGIQNTIYDRRPAVIVRPVDALDVSRAVITARDLGLEIAVKGGGHSLAGHSAIEGGMLIDLGAMRGVDIDPVRRVGCAEGGVTAGAYTLAAHQHGLATPFGDSTTVGLGGLTLGGGLGWLVRRHGLTLDSLLEAELVMADGQVVTVNEDSDPDLFWAIRGGGGNFGIATRFRFRLHPVGTVTGGALALPLTRSVLRNLIEVSLAAPESLSQITSVISLPAAPFVPADVVGTPAVVVMPVHVGDPTAGAAAMAPFRSLATPIADLVGPIPYPAMYAFTRGGEQPGPGVLRSAFLPSLDDAAIDAIVERHSSPAGAAAMTQLRVLGGAMARVANDATAFAHRDAPVLAAIISHVIGSLEDSTAWTDRYLADLAVRGTGVYANYLGDEGEARVRQAYPAATYERLAIVKGRVDPDNVFHANHNIRPA